MLNSPTPDPHQGYRRSRLQQDAPPAWPFANTASTDTDQTASPTIITSRDSYYGAAGSPSRKQLPLRQTVSYSYVEQSTKADQGPSGPSWVGSNNMSFTGDGRDAGRPMNGARSRNFGARTDDISPGMSDAITIDTTATIEPPLQTSIATPATNNATTPASATSRFAFFSTALKSFSSSPAPASHDADDQLLTLDITKALFPSGSPTDQDTFSPAAFKNLQMTATGLLQRFQSAYQHRTSELLELTADREAHIDEKEEMDTKLQHLKMQLQGMARRATEQEEIMKSLMEELAHEKKLRFEERQASEENATLREGSTVSEDLGVEDDQHKRQWRRSGGTFKSDLSLDTDEESVEGASVFSSRSRSPTIATTITDMSPTDSPGTKSMPRLSPMPVTPRTTPRPPQQPQMTTLQKLFKGISSDAAKEASRSPGNCRNCQGQDASVAWDTVNLLKDENRGLKDRVGELESAVEGALDAVNGIGL